MYHRILKFLSWVSGIEEHELGIVNLLENIFGAIWHFNISELGIRKLETGVFVLGIETSSGYGYGYDI